MRNPYLYGTNRKGMKRIAALLIFCFAVGTASAQIEFYGKDIPETLKETKLCGVMSGSELFQVQLKEALEQHWDLTAVEFIDQNAFETRKSDPAYSFLYLQSGEVNGHATDFLTLAIGNKKKSEQPLDVKQLIVDKKKISDEGAPMVHLYVKQIQHYVNAVAAGDITDQTFSDRFVTDVTYRIKEIPLIVREKDFDSTLDDEASRTEWFKGELIIADQERINTAVIEEEDVAVVDVILTGERYNMYCYKRIYDAASGAILYSEDTESLHGKKQGIIQDDFKSIVKAR